MNKIPPDLPASQYSHLSAPYARLPDFRIPLAKRMGIGTTELDARITVIVRTWLAALDAVTDEASILLLDPLPYSKAR